MGVEGKKTEEILDVCWSDTYNRSDVLIIIGTLYAILQEVQNENLEYYIKIISE